MSRHRDPDRPRDPLVQIDITLTVPRPLVWLLTGAAIGHLNIVGRIVDLLRVLAG